MNLCIIFLVVFENVTGYMVGNNPHHHRESLDPKGRFQLEWLVDWENKEVTFTVTVQTKGYVGLGLSRNGKMTGADIVIGGVNSKGESYLADYHAVDHQAPVRDSNQNWNLLSGKKNETHTTLCFSRAIDTCDPHDYLITRDKVAVIWAFGETDKPTYHHENRGMFNVYLLAPDHSPLIITDPHSGGQQVLDGHGNIDTSVKVWTIDRQITLPRQETTYVCRIHKTPRLGQKHHLIGMNVRLQDEASRRHTHHLIVLHCQAPLNGPSAQSLFEPLVGTVLEECMVHRDSAGETSANYCVETRYNWGVGGASYFHPPHVGFPFDSEDYLATQIHLDNPTLVPNVTVNISLDFFYTTRLRPNEGGTFAVRHVIPGLPPSFLIPPYSIDYQIRGMCGSKCTQDMIPPEGISVYGVFLHSHGAGRKVRVRHFRKKLELPFIAVDENYLHSFQQVQTFPQETKVLPGDQIIVECVHDTTGSSGTVVGGFSTSQEMCTASLYHYTRVSDIYECSSQIVSVGDRQHFLDGVGNVTWSINRIGYLVDPPHSLAGLSISEVSDNHVDWSIAKREELRNYHLYSPHINLCPAGPWVSAGSLVGVTISFPYAARPYKPDSSCSGANIF